jgi:peroxiredoxin
MKRWIPFLFLAAAPVLAGEHPVGKPAPDFSLTDITGQVRKLSDFKGQTVVLEWTNYRCPFVRKHYGSGNMQALQKEWTAKGVVWLSICSSSEGKEGFMTPAEWRKAAAEKGAASTAILLDPDGKVGRLYGAKTTPHMFVIDSKGLLAYKGAIDDRPSTDPADIPGAKNYVRMVLEDLAAGRISRVASTTSYGCSVKYRGH